MDLTNSTVKTPDADTETPTRIQPAKPAPFSNGVLKRHAPLQLHHPVVVTYKECLKNHAATLGTHAVDGCGEFMPSPTTNPADPTSLTCAACGCHRNFHRREPEESSLLPSPPNAIEYRSHHRHHPPPPPPPRANSGGSSPNNSPSPPPISSSYYPSAPHMLLALSHGGALPPPPPEAIPTVSAVINSNSSSRKRFRTKFTQNQKDKMLEFAEKVGWKMQKRDEDAINEFCTEIGVEKGVLKVWMHNNKSVFSKKDLQTAIFNPPTAATNGGGINHSAIAAAEPPYNHHHHHEDHNDHHHDNSILGTNGSSSS